MKEQKLVLNNIDYIKATRRKIKSPSKKYQKIIDEANRQIEISKEREGKALIKARTFIAR